MVEPYEGTCYLWTRSEIRFCLFVRKVRSQTGTKAAKVTRVGSTTEIKSDRCEFIFRLVNAWKEMYGDRYELKKFVPVSCKYPLVLLVRKSTFDLRFSLFSLKMDFKYPLLILPFDFWCVATVGRRSWQVVREAKNAVSVEKIEIALSKIAKLPWANWNRREQIEIAVNKLKLPWANE